MKISRTAMLKFKITIRMLVSQSRLFTFNRSCRNSYILMQWVVKISIHRIVAFHLKINIYVKLFGPNFTKMSVSFVLNSNWMLYFSVIVVQAWNKLQTLWLFLMRKINYSQSSASINYIWELTLFENNSFLFLLCHIIFFKEKGISFNIYSGGETE